MYLNTRSNGIEAGLSLLLTSAGPTTEAIQEDLLSKSQRTKSAGSQVLRVLRVADGWKPFDSSDQVSLVDRTAQRAESFGARLWSNTYLRHVLGKHTAIQTETLGAASPHYVDSLLNHIDMILVPGGNTWQTMRGINPHRSALLDAVRSGVPYVGESAGTIVAGQTLYPANLDPADPRPGQLNGECSQGLNLVGADIIVHAKGRSQDIAIPGPIARMTGLALSFAETPIKDICEYHDINTGLGIQTYALDDDEALTVNGGTALEII